MTNYTNYSDRERLEKLINQNEENRVKSKPHFSLINSIWKYIVTAMANGHEPRIWKSTDRAGNTWWHGYDPITDQTVCLDSEVEMRVWIEERYYQ